MPDPTPKKELKCGQTVFCFYENGIKETKIIAVNEMHRFTAAERVETVREYFVEGKIQMDPEKLFHSKQELLASL